MERVTTRTAREVLREWGFDDALLATWSDQECEEQYEVIRTYPEDDGGQSE